MFYIVRYNISEKTPTIRQPRMSDHLVTAARKNSLLIVKGRECHLLLPQYAIKWYFLMVIFIVWFTAFNFLPLCPPTPIAIVHLIIHGVPKSSDNQDSWVGKLSLQTKCVLFNCSTLQLFPVWVFCLVFLPSPQPVTVHGCPSLSMVLPAVSC